MINIYNNNDAIFYQAVGFREEVAVTGFIIFPDMTKSLESSFTELGDGIYYLKVCLKGLKGYKDMDKFGVVIKENDVTKKFETIFVDN